MVELENIRRLSDDIMREFKPECVILFGSYAYGTPTTESDVDLLVVLRFEGKPIRKAVEILNRVNSKIPLDLIVRAPEQVKSRIAHKDSFMCEVFEKGRRLYESDSV